MDNARGDGLRWFQLKALGVSLLLLSACSQATVTKRPVETVAFEVIEFDYHLNYLDTSSDGFFWLFQFDEKLGVSPLLEFDPKTMSVRRSTDLFGRMLAVPEENTIWIATHQDFEVPRIGPDVGNEEIDDVFRFDTTTWTLAEKFTSSEYVNYAMAYLDGRLWLSSDIGSLRVLDPSTGVGPREFMAKNSKVRFGRLDYWDGYLWMATGRNIVKVDPATGEGLFVLGVDDHLEDPNDPGDTTIQYYQGKFWVLGEVYSQPGFALQLDPETMELSNPTPLDQIPSYHIELGDYRWELYSSLWSTKRTGALAARWKQVDLETGEVIDEFNFGAYTPFAQVDGYLWFEDPRGYEAGLARVALADLPAQAFSA